MNHQPVLVNGARLGAGRDEAGARPRHDRLARLRVDLANGLTDVASQTRVWLQLACLSVRDTTKLGSAFASGLGRDALKGKLDTVFFQGTFDFAHL
jgi:hypothetical protein